MNIPFDFTAAGTGGAASFFKLFDQTANLVLANMISAAVSGSDAFGKLQPFGLGAIDGTGPGSGAKTPLIIKRAFFLRSLSVTINQAAKVRFGVLKSDNTTFAPCYVTYATEAVAGGIFRYFPDGARVPNDNTTWFAALEVTPDASVTFRVAGDIEILPDTGNTTI